jgi:hypothetical protein
MRFMIIQYNRLRSHVKHRHVVKAKKHAGMFFLAVALAFSGPQHGMAKIQFQIDGNVETVYYVDISYDFQNGQPLPALVVNGWYIDPDGNKQVFNGLNNSVTIKQTVGLSYYAHTTQFLVEASPAADAEVEGLGFGIFFNFAGVPYNVKAGPCEMNAVATVPNDPVFGDPNYGGLQEVLQDNGLSLVGSSSASSCFIDGQHCSDYSYYPTNAVIYSAGAHCYYSYVNNPAIMYEFMFAQASALPLLGGVDTDEDWPSAYVDSTLVGYWYIEPQGSFSPEDSTEGGLSVTIIAQTNALSAAGTGSALLPNNVVYPSNSVLPVYYFSNLLSGSSCGVPGPWPLDYGYDLQTVGSALFQTATLPANWTGAVSVSISNTFLGSFQAGQIISFTDFPGGGVGEFSIMGDGQPLAVPAGGFPITPTFNSDASDVTVAPLVLQLAFPNSDQCLAGGNTLIMPVGVQSDLGLAYQWQFNDADLIGQSNFVLTLNAVTATNTGQYRVVMSTASDGVTNYWYGPEANVVVLAPTFTSVNMAGGSLIASGFGGSPQGTYYVLCATNLVSSQWTPISTNQFDIDGSFVFTNAVNPGSAQVFYELQLP